MTDEQPAPKKRHGTEKRQRQKITPIRWEMGEFNKAAAKANKVGLSFGAWIRALAQDGDAGARSMRIPSVNAGLLFQVKGMVGSIGNNVNQIARNLNMGDFYDLPEIRLVMKNILRLTDLMFVALGKDPSPEMADWDQFVDVAKQGLAAQPGAKSVSIPADLLKRLIGSTAAMVALHPSERPGVEAGKVPDAPFESQFLPPEGHA